MSMITVTNIKATGETASRAVSGVAAAWVDYAPPTATLNDSVNVSTLTDNGTGDFTFSFTSNMASTAYSYSADAAHTSLSTSNVLSVLYQTSDKLAASCRFAIGYSSSTSNYTKFDYTQAASTIHGDLA